MLNYNTLLSAYDDKLTLMQWLKKVEAALKDASAVSFNVNKRGNATITFSVVFEDGSELETGPIILQQGESVTNAAITNGHLILTLSNGDTLDAGNTGAVSGFFINGAQHLIVQYQDGTTNDLGAIFNGSIYINGDISATGDIYGVKIENIKDASNNNRFIEGTIALNSSLSGVIATYARWSLSGTHLMVVLGLEIDANTTILQNDVVGTCNVPSWLFDKIYPLKGIGVAWGTFENINSDWTREDTKIVLIRQHGELQIAFDADKTYSKSNVIRINFDILVGNQ